MIEGPNSKFKGFCFLLANAQISRHLIFLESCMFCPKTNVWQFGILKVYHNFSSGQIKLTQYKSIPDDVSQNKCLEIWQSGRIWQCWHAQSPSRLLLLVSLCLRDTALSCTFLPLQILMILSQKMQLSS